MEINDILKDALMQLAIEREGHEEIVPCGDKPYNYLDGKPVFWYNVKQGDTTKIVIYEQ